MGTLAKKIGKSDFEATFAGNTPSSKCSSPSFAATIRKLLTRRRLRCLKVLRTWWGYTAREGVTREQVAPLKKTPFRKSPLTYVMKLTSPVRSGLIGGIVDFVVAHDLPQLTVKLASHICQSACSPRPHSPL